MNSLMLSSVQVLSRAVITAASLLFSAAAFAQTAPASEPAAVPATPAATAAPKVAPTNDSTLVKCVDKKTGKVEYTDAREAGKRDCAPVQIEPNVIAPPTRTLNTKPMKPMAQPGPRGSDPESLKKNLDYAQAKLTEARQALEAQEAVRYGNERNYQKVLDRLKPYQDAVAQQEKEVARLESAVGAATKETAPR